MWSARKESILPIRYYIALIENFQKSIIQKFFRNFAKMGRTEKGRSFLTLSVDQLLYTGMTFAIFVFFFYIPDVNEELKILDSRILLYITFSTTCILTSIPSKTTARSIFLHCSVSVRALDS